MKTCLLALMLPLLFATGCARTAPQPAAQATSTATATSMAQPTSAARSSERATAALPCPANSLQLSFGGRDGEFTGMSHDGAWLVLRNTGKQPCTVPRRPQLDFTDAAGNPVELQIPMPPGMHPGPVLVPITLQPGATASGTMRWVSNDVYDNGRCVAPENASLTVEGGKVNAVLHAQVCGPAGAPPQYEQQFLRLGEAEHSAAATH